MAVALHCTALHCTALHCTALHWSLVTGLDVTHHLSDSVRLPVVT